MQMLVKRLILITSNLEVSFIFIFLYTNINSYIIRNYLNKYGFQFNLATQMILQLIINQSILKIQIKIMFQK